MRFPKTKVNSSQAPFYEPSIPETFVFMNRMSRCLYPANIMHSRIFVPGQIYMRALYPRLTYLNFRIMDAFLENKSS